MEVERARPAVSGLYLVLLISSIVVSYFLGKAQSFKNPEVSTQVLGVSDIEAADTFRVTKVEAVALSPNQTGCLYKQFGFTGEITTNGPGTVKYEWEGNDNSLMSPVILTFDSAGTKYVSTAWQVYGAGKRWLKLHIYSPNDMNSSEVPFELDCK